MEIRNIAALATAMTSSATRQAVAIAVANKAMDIQANGASALLQALPPPAASLPSHIGHNVNTTA